MGAVGFAKKVWAEVNQDDAFTWGSALAYAWIFAIFPFMIFLLSLAPYLPGGVKDRVMTEVGNVAYTSVGGEAGYNVVKSVQDVMSQQHGGLLSIGLLIALWGASGGMSMTMSALDKAYYVHCSRGFVKQRLIAMALTVAVAVLILLVMLLLPIGTAVVNYLTTHGHLGAVGSILANVVRYVVAIALMFTIVALIYYFGPCIKQKWQTVTPGAVFTVAVWILLGFAFSFYVTKFGNFNKTYGALGGAIILLLFFYINAVVLLIGAEVNSVIDFETLDVKPGAVDLTQAVAKAQYEQADAEQEQGAKTEGGPGRSLGSATATAAARVTTDPPPPSPARPGRRRKLVVYTSSFLALRWAWKKFWMARAKRKAHEREVQSRRPWWTRRVAS
jgi:membrane protein